MGTLQSMALPEAFSCVTQCICLLSASVNGEKLLEAACERNQILQLFPSAQVQQQNLDFYIQAPVRRHNLQCFAILNLFVFC